MSDLALISPSLLLTHWFELKVMVDRSTNEGLEKGDFARGLRKLDAIMPLVLCVFLIACYGFYIFSLFQSSLGLLHKYDQYFDLLSTLNSLYSFGKFGISVFAVVESLLLINYLKSGTISRRSFVYLMLAVVVFNLLIYSLVSYLYGYVKTLL
ncbi:MAG: hypothetical protein QG670_1327 [Thermoproteota archaeon]|nr:hypothetical protein [Thermoproteota archaeon]